MPKRNDISSILLIGSGPIVIGQACEFDYSGTQACRSLREDGFKVILVNSNPATIMTDPDLTDITYIEPLSLAILEKIIEKERPDALLPTMGGQTALNLAMELFEAKILEKYNVELIGASVEAISTAENREKFKAAMTEIGLEVPESGFAHSLEEALAVGEEIGYPLIIRPSYILGGKGTGIADNREAFLKLAAEGLDASPVSEILVERSIAGWKEYELEVMRDKNDNCVVVCGIENLDPMGVHTGDSITVAPIQTLSDPEYQKMRDAAFRCIRRVGVETGGSNIQFAVNPQTGEQLVIEMNPRVSRSSALASKATGFPIAKIAARLAVGYSLDEITNDITKKTPASFEPTIDYVVTKVPRWAFEKLPGTKDILGTRMQSVGEVMAIGRTFPESLQKAMRALEKGRFGLNCDPAETRWDNFSDEELLEKVAKATTDRIFILEALLRRLVSPDRLHEVTGIDIWFLDQINLICEARQFLDRLAEEKTFGQNGENLSLFSKDTWKYLKQLGFSDAQIAWRLGLDESVVRGDRLEKKVLPVYKTVDTCAAEFEAETPYYYSSFEEEDELTKAEKERVIILGSGPNRIGQGIEFDYCCVHAAFALQEAGYEAVMINCNPETVSTDYDTSDRLYFEPITYEDVLSVIAKEQQLGAGGLKGVIVTLGGQTPLKLAGLIPKDLVLGTSAESIDLAEDRKMWSQLLSGLNIAQPKGALVKNLEEAEKAVLEIGFPVLVRPSYVLGGRAMEIVYGMEDLKRVMAELGAAGSLGIEGGLSAERPVLIDKFLEDAVEVDVDALRDANGDVMIGAVLEHVEEAGVHSGDSACATPPPTLSDQVISLIESHTFRIAEALSVIGPLNVQYGVKDNEVFVIEANPRASRTVPFAAKATGVQLAKIAARVIVGETIGDLLEQGLIPKRAKIINHDSFSVSGDPGAPEEDFVSGQRDDRRKFVCVKEAVLPFDRFPDVDAILGPEMRSTGEVMGIASNFPLAFYKSQIAAGNIFPQSGCVFLSLSDHDKKQGLQVALSLKESGFSIAATHGTYKYLEANGLNPDILVAKLSVDEKEENSEISSGENLSNALELIEKGLIQFVINTPRGRGPHADGQYIRHAAQVNHIPLVTTISAAKAAVSGIAEACAKGLDVISLQEMYTFYGNN